MVEDPTDTTTRVREADLQRHLENNKAAEAKGEAPRAKPAASAAPAQAVKPTELGSKEDFQLAQAIALLKGEPVQTTAPKVAQNQQPAN
jgi:carboxyl-terminal processing protease